MLSVSFVRPHPGTVDSKNDCASYTLLAYKLWSGTAYGAKIVYCLFAISCTKQKKTNYLNFHGEEAQEKPPGLQGMGSLS